MLKNKWLYVGLLLLLYGNTVSAESVLEKKLRQSKATSQEYVAGNRSLTPDTQQRDVSELAGSVEFEVFKINEDSTSHTTFKSNAGICYGFNQGDGVQVTDTSTYYMTKNSQEEYYSNISGADISQSKMPKQVKYVPIFNIYDQEMLKKIQDEDKKLGNQLAQVNIEERRKVLANMVCQKKTGK